MKNKKTGKTTLSIRRGYRDINGKVKNVTIEYLGDLEMLKINMIIRLSILKKS